ncbi:Phosphatidylglycerol/phosphatidylinositol transfer protein [Clonorchis sinensis]|uniref:Phosphatidylglycerol/phosphatidylinositol transfer protein n=1 Tax=Clonorchis sinensis TaxID=79923 RepID=A0A8T1N2A3_CLOSI|nr:Phosphatidylglycerol/phosphatidylinositol transfer protein [Clonorchis sinensis]
MSPFSLCLAQLTNFLIICALDKTSAISFRDCGSVGATLVAVDVTPCNDDPCVLSRDSVATIRIAFRPLIAIDVRGYTMQGTIANQRVSVTLPQNGVCGRINPSCVLQAGEIYNYFFSALVPANVRSGPMLVRWELLNTRNEMFLCFEFTVQLV